MGGHGGLNILPQKKWNVYNFDNREKVKKDEEAAAKEEQQKQQQSRKRDAEFRVEKLRAARGLPSAVAAKELEKPSTLNHINFFQGVKYISQIEGESKVDNDLRREMKRMKREEANKVVAPEDEKYKMGYGLIGKGVKAPWYLTKRSDEGNLESRKEVEIGEEEGVKKSGKKTLEEMREERLKREKREKQRELLLVSEKTGGGADIPKFTRFSRH
ncbi:hypothetical protein GIB67_013163 [Kingdonia uniflora]|uniref:CBF1-interacting co-repressor CIR N-terminal domain-containing protein n=1 Tax=Kingdonia uniflora TaxID=39325 RepID=A0A7J7LD05_9MAGN|nr:hypothetical protein GIB67_013163 [Kingdonia uniflora]